MAMYKPGLFQFKDGCFILSDLSSFFSSDDLGAFAEGFTGQELLASNPDTTSLMDHCDMLCGFAPTSMEINDYDFPFLSDRNSIPFHASIENSLSDILQTYAYIGLPETSDCHAIDQLHLLQTPKTPSRDVCEEAGYLPVAVPSIETPRNTLFNDIDELFQARTETSTSSSWLPTDNQSSDASRLDSVCSSSKQSEDLQTPKDREPLTRSTLGWNCLTQSYVMTPWIDRHSTLHNNTKSKERVLLETGNFEFCVIRAYKRQAVDELSLEQVQTVNVMSVYDDGFCFGSILEPPKNRYGMFPLSHLQGTVEVSVQQSVKWRRSIGKRNDAPSDGGSDLERSMRRKSSIMCKICDRTFGHKMSLKRHLFVMHGADARPSHECQNCGKKFHRADSLRRHMKKESLREDMTRNNGLFTS